MRVLLYLFLVIILQGSCTAQQCDVDLSPYATGFDRISAADFSFLDEELDGVRIVGYGEDTHGTAEFTTMAQEMMRYMAEEHGFRLFVIETGFGEGQYLEDYIQGRRDDLVEIMAQHNSTWRYETDEFYAMMEWLREYNRAHPSDPIHLYGCEMQYVTDDVGRIEAYLASVGADYTIEGFDKHLWQSWEDSEETDHYIAYAQLKAYFDENREAFIAKSSERSYQLAYQHVMVLGQFVSAIIQNVYQRMNDLRDIYMGENIQWIMNHHGSDSQALYWAHNAHVGDWISNGIVDVTGHQLKKIYGPAYYKIATDFGTGEYRAFSADPTVSDIQTIQVDEIIDGTITQCLQQLGSPNAFVNLRAARQDPSIRLYLDQPLTTMAGAGAQARGTTTETNYMGRAFDAIIYLDRSSVITWRE